MTDANGAWDEPILHFIICMRYVIGIDLGTTNSSLAYVDTHKTPYAIQIFSIPQLVTADRVESKFSLPSFCYLLPQLSHDSFQLPWKQEKTTCVGEFAKREGALVPTRLIQSAKSWLSYSAANRKEKILPLEMEDPSKRLSPVEVSANYLLHLKEAWNATIGKKDPLGLFEEQEIIVTVPASFDEVARALTVEAAKMAGYQHLTLLEEPQAAFYSWISHNESNWNDLLKAGDTILVCDIGGGTTDFSLIEVKDKEGHLTFQRMAVGDHLLLGGDNVDNAIAYDLEQKLQQNGVNSLSSSQWLQLKAEARRIKELLLDSSHEKAEVVLQGTGSTIVKGTISLTVKKDELEAFILKGFFDEYDLDKALQVKKSRGFRTVGLPYEDEPSITKQMASFLQKAGYLYPNNLKNWDLDLAKAPESDPSKTTPYYNIGSFSMVKSRELSLKSKTNFSSCLGIEKGKQITHLLFNGGTMKPLIFQRAIHQSLKKWFSAPITILESKNLDLAVAKGAAYYGKVRRGLGVAIEGGLPRTYYLELDVKNSSGTFERYALTLLPRGSLEEAIFQPEQTFHLKPNIPVAFQLLASHTRLHDAQGELISIDEQLMQRLPPICTILRFGKQHLHGEEFIPVRLGIKLTAVGTLELWLESKNSDHRWNLEFQLRTALSQDDQQMNERSQQNEIVDEASLFSVEKMIQELYTSKQSSIMPNTVVEKIEQQLGREKKDWSSHVLRRLWEPLLKHASGRHHSLSHAVRWWNLAGYFLRPGFGYPLDDFRIKELWKIILNDLKVKHPFEREIQLWICFRRIAGGLNKGQQMQIASELMAHLFHQKTGKIEIKGKNELYSYAEKIRALAALEKMDHSLKIRIGEALVDRIAKNDFIESDFWALGRIGARQLVYGSAGDIISKDICSKWIERLLKVDSGGPEQWKFLFRQLARKTDQRELEIPMTIKEQIMNKYDDEQLREILFQGQRLELQEQERIIGDQLPLGLCYHQVSDG